MRYLESSRKKPKDCTGNSLSVKDTRKAEDVRLTAEPAWVGWKRKMRLKWNHLNEVLKREPARTWRHRMRTWADFVAGLQKTSSEILQGRTMLKYHRITGVSIDSVKCKISEVREPH